MTTPQFDGSLGVGSTQDVFSLGLDFLSRMCSSSGGGTRLGGRQDECGTSEFDPSRKGAPLDRVYLVSHPADARYVRFYDYL